MDEILLRALAPVLRDLAVDGLAAPSLAGPEWTDDPGFPSAMMLAADGTGAGVSVSRSAPEFERIASAADQVQEWVIESQLWGSAPTNWPRCPRHVDGHPLRASTAALRAVWCCPADLAVIAEVGGL